MKQPLGPAALPRTLILLRRSVLLLLFVIVAKETRTKAARIALRRLADVHAHIVGAVLTKFNPRQAGYEYGYSYYEYSSAPKPKLLERAKRALTRE